MKTPDHWKVTDHAICDVSIQWLIHYDLARMLRGVAEQWERETGRDFWLISGYRSAAEQAQLAEEGRPTAPDDRSTHRTCPATGVDVWIGPLPTNAMKATLGRIVGDHGLRWGGGSRVDAETGIPLDWNHLDMGPRQT
jgi:hypothetical protein